jgi:hypothetical protein
MSNKSDTSRPVLDQFGEDETIPFTNRTMGDLWLLVYAFVGGMFALIILPKGYQLIGWIVGGVGMLAAIVLIKIAPSYRRPHEWVTAAVKFRFATSKTMTPHNPSDPDHKPESLTNLDHFDTIRGTAERIDGALVGLMKVHAGNMALASDEQLEDMADEFARFINRLEFDMQIYSSGRRIDPDTLVKPYRARAQDADIRHNDQLRELVSTYQEKLPRVFRERGTSVREYYIVVAVTPMEIRLRNRSSTGQIADWPVVGNLFKSFTILRDDIPEHELKSLQRRELEKRLQRVGKGVQQLSDCTAEPVDAGEHSDLLEEFWTGERVDYGDSESRLHRLPLVVRDEDEEMKEVSP